MEHTITSNLKFKANEASQKNRFMSIQYTYQKVLIWMLNDFTEFNSNSLAYITKYEQVDESINFS